MQLLKALWIRWKILAHRLANFQARVILTLFYFVVFCPFGVCMKLLSDPLRLKSRDATRWAARSSAVGDVLTLARRQF